MILSLQVTRLKWPYVRTILSTLLMFVDVAQNNASLSVSIEALDTVLGFVEEEELVVKG